MQPNFAIIIPTKNEEADLPRLLESILRQGFPSDHIVVVDNESTDRTRLIAAQFRTQIVDGGPNQSAQRNIGADLITAQAVYFVDADMELEDGLLDELCGLIRSGAECIVVPERTVAEDWLGRARAFEREMFEGDSSIEAARVFSKRIFEACGGYNAEITGGEDWLLSQRVRARVTGTRSSRYARHYEGRLYLLPLLRKYIKYGRGYYSLFRLGPQMLMEHSNPLRGSIIANRRKLLSNPGEAARLVVYKLLTYLAGLVGFASEAARRVTSRSSSR